MNDKEKELKQDNEQSLEQDTTQASADTEETAREREAAANEAEFADADDHKDEPFDRDEEEREDDARRAVPAAFVSKPSRGGKAWMYISLGLALILIVVLIKPPFGGSSGKQAVGSVNGVSITKDQLYDAMAKLGGAQTMDNLIQDELIKQEADKKNIVISDADVDKEIANIKKRFPSEAEFESALQQSGMTLDDLKAQTPMQLRIRKILEPQAQVTDKDVEDYFNQNKAQYDQPEEVKASHILVATKEEADAIIKQLEGGADFAALAKEKSTDTGSKDNGGDLGFFGKGAMDPAFEKAAFALKVGEMTKEPVKSQYGYHIIKVTDRHEAKASTLAEKKDEIKEQLIQSKVSDLSTAWLDDLKKKSQITNTLSTAAAATGDASTGNVPTGNAATGNATTNN
ncbi:foldase protein PrsA [Paenibacillus sp. UNC496MF]|uniref:peptidylprolyl isomerase n=1 Tax=Paenibacillus sp. UNC496MF TaxID=1502753 RepID=UPI0008E158EF|nr:peptidylprolyl isomerase [Paenibacillus sp. UNC496MF]SFI54340.1 foldase protein PrsA [Paenibacillus sp. UNC496MF]